MPIPLFEFFHFLEVGRGEYIKRDFLTGLKESIKNA